MNSSKPPLAVHALASLIAGLMALFMGGPVLGFAAIVLGVLGLNMIQRYDGSVSGKPLAWTGIVAGGATILLQTMAKKSETPLAEGIKDWLGMF